MARTKSSEHGQHAVKRRQPRRVEDTPNSPQVEQDAEAGRASTPFDLVTGEYVGS